MHLQELLQKHKIFHYFELEHHICIEIDASGFAISGVLI